jgi:hypothetical protein
MNAKDWLSLHLLSSVVTVVAKSKREISAFCFVDEYWGGRNDIVAIEKKNG